MSESDEDKKRRHDREEFEDRRWRAMQARQAQERERRAAEAVERAQAKVAAEQAKREAEAAKKAAQATGGSSCMLVLALFILDSRTLYIILSWWN